MSTDTTTAPPTFDDFQAAVAQAQANKAAVASAGQADAAAQAALDQANTGKRDSAQALTAAQQQLAATAASLHNLVTELYGPPSA